VSSISTVPAADWERWVSENDAVLLDVREPHEWEKGTLPDAVLIPLGELMGRIEELPKDSPVLCVCRSGSRSAHVAAFLSLHGYDTANMIGGMKALGLQD
jgi:rhodanese-related sulfurtransferase